MVRDSKESGMESRAAACSGTEWRAKFCYDKFGSGSGRKAGVVMERSAGERLGTERNGGVRSGGVRSG